MEGKDNMITAQQHLDSFRTDTTDFFISSGTTAYGVMDFKNHTKVKKIKLLENKSITALINLPTTLEILNIMDSALSQDINDFAHLVNLEYFSAAFSKTFYGDFKAFYNMRSL